jgi:hypothetical protein
MRYELSIAAIFKNEEKYLDEWIKHHLNRGVDQLYLINDFSDDNYLDIIYPYLKDKHVTLIENHAEDFSYGRQDRIYNMSLYNYVRSSNWIAIIDIDEYLWSPITIDLKKITEQFDNLNLEGAIIWNVVFGGNGHIKQPSSIVNSFTKREDVVSKLKKYKFNKASGQKYLLQAYYCKQIIKTKNFQRFGVHLHNFDGYKDFRNKNIILNPFDLENNILRINHYKWQSKERWNHKIRIPDVNSIEPQKMSHIEPFREKFLNKEMSKTSEIMRKNKFTNYRQIHNLYEIIEPEVNELEDLGLKNQNFKNNESRNP